MNEWLIVPRDPLIFRDGKPFTATPGERANSLPFPYPSTLAGAVRTRSGTDLQKGFDDSRISELLGKSIRGPILVELDSNGNIVEHYFPAPADSLLVESKEPDQVLRYALVPINISNDSFTDLTELSLVGPNKQIKNKPSKNAPRFWKWSEIEAWLQGAGDSTEAFDPKNLGLNELPQDRRTHVSIDPMLQASRERALFQTSAVEFTHAIVNKENRLVEARSLAIAFETDAVLTTGMGFLGGERRVAQWQEAKNALPGSEKISVIKKQIEASRSCRLILASPAYFSNGHLPDYLTTKFGAKVVAAALSRYQTISGWDYAKPNGGEPKPTRRLVPAGSVYFLNLEGVKDIDAFIEAVWLKAMSDDEQARRDGFGLALLGVWKNKEVKS
ncbi:MAG: type III-B CRISPR module-associated protein Cmr3 [Anaerolineales bacterium]